MGLTSEQTKLMEEVDQFVKYGLIDSALKWLEKALADDPNNRVARARLAQLRAEFSHLFEAES